MPIPTLIDIVRNAVSAFAGGADPWSVLKLTTSPSSTVITFADVAGMTFTGAPNTWYEVECFGAYRSAATTTGIALALGIPSGTVQGSNIVYTSSTAVGGTQQNATGTTTAASTGVAVINSDTPILGRFLVQVGATGGEVTLRIRSEVAGSAVTLQAGKFLMKWRALP